MLIPSIGSLFGIYRGLNAVSWGCWDYFDAILVISERDALSDAAFRGIF